MAKRRGRAPNEEWVLMYRRGLSLRRVAELVEAAPATVGYHLRLARERDPSLQVDHEAAVGRKPARVTVQGLERMRQLVAMVEETGRYPSRLAGSRSERTLAAWLQRRREDARAGALAPPFRDGLNVLPDWVTPSRVDAKESRWQEQLAALVKYREAGFDWPRHKSVISGEEHELGVWLHSQRIKLRRGELDREKADILDAELPGWQVGRKRGRRPQASDSPKSDKEPNR